MGERAFSLYDIEQFIREAGAERVTEEAVVDLERELEKLAESVAQRAIRYAEHAGRRRLVNKKDVLLAKPRIAFRR
jgi:histone H3/H4